jgi:ATP-dependent Clp protease adaptor protein ClpS
MTTDTRAKIKPQLDLKEPNKFKIVYINDEVTTMEFVLDSLTSIFGYDDESAAAIVTQIHEAGSAVVAVYPFEIAEQKGIEVTMLAREQGFPMQVKLEEDR